MASFMELFFPCCASILLFWWLRKAFINNQRSFRKLKPVLGRVSGQENYDLELQIRILSQNMWCTNSWGAVKKGSKGPQVQRRFTEFVRAVVEGGYDVLLLQELFAYRIAYFFLTIDDVVYLTEQLEAAGFIYHSDVVYNLPVLLGQSSGVAIFSKYPIVNWEGHTFRKHSLKDSLNAKGFVQATIAVGDQHLSFFSAHLDSSKTSDAKKFQVNQLVGSVAKVVPKDGVIVAGDFNICSHSSHTRTLYSHLSSSMSGIGMKSIFTDLPYTHRAGSTLDHAFIGGRNLSLSNVSSQHSVHLTTEVKDLPVSDHDGLSFTINL